MRRIQQGWSAMSLFGSLACVAACSTAPDRPQLLESGPTPDGAGGHELESSDGNRFGATDAGSIIASKTVTECGTGDNDADPPQTVHYVLAYESPLARWCVDAEYLKRPGFAKALEHFYAYGDRVYERLQALFKMPLKERFVYQLWNSAKGSAHTGTDFGRGVTVPVDDVVNSYDPDNQRGLGYWTYLLTLHEGINVFTGMVSENWPTDWWADHRSPFPNSFDAIIMQEMGEATHDSALLEGAQIQRERFGSAASNPDTEVMMFDELYKDHGGYASFENTFALMQADGISWARIAPQGQSERLTEYVIAYLQLGNRTSDDLTQTLFVASGVGELDPSLKYKVDSGAVRAIATAHCSIRAAQSAGKNVTSSLAALRAGEYSKALTSGGRAAGCPTECVWKSQTSSCIARF